jgi:hypothetical protein
LICPSSSKTGICSERKPCKLKHIKKKPKYMSKEISGERLVNLSLDLP